MKSQIKSVKARLLCGYEQWWRYNVHMMLVGYDMEGNTVCFENFSDRVYDMDYYASRLTPPEGYEADRKIEVICGECDYAHLYFYVVANTFPASSVVKDSPPFPVGLEIYIDGELVQQKEFEVNQWGGLTVSEYLIGNDGQDAGRN